MDKWEYKILKMKMGTRSEGFIDEQGMLNHLGSDGWEVISTSTFANSMDYASCFMFVFLKRKLK